MTIRSLSAIALCVLLTISAAGGARMVPSSQVAAAGPSLTASLSSTITVVGSDTVSAGNFGSVRVECPIGMVAIGGGIDPENVLTMKVTSSGPTFDQNNERLIFQPDGANPAPIGWQASARNDGTTTKSFKVAVICAPISSVTTVVGSDTASAGSFGSERVECPRGKYAIGGGIDLDNVLTMVVTSSGPTFIQNNNRLIFQPDGTSPAPVGWQASTRNEATTTKSFKVAVICAPISGVTTVVGSDTARARSFGSERVECPRGKIAVGGGIDPDNVLTMNVSSSGPTFDQNNDRLFFQPDGTNPAPIGWQASTSNDATTTKPFKVAVICAQPPNEIFLPLVTK